MREGERDSSLACLFRVLGQSLSRLPSKLGFIIGHVFSHLSAPVGCIQVNALFHILFHQPPHLDLLPGLAVHFCFLLRPRVRDMAHALFEVAAVCLQNTTCFCAVTGPYSELGNFYIWKFTIEFDSMAYISMSAHIKFAAEHSATFGSSYSYSWSLFIW